MKNGIIYDGKKYNFIIKEFSLDAPVKSFILGIKGQDGYLSCTKWEVEGDNLERRIYFLDENARLRSDEDFSNRVDDGYHNEK